MELWDLYDENRNLTGRYHVRGEPIPDGFYHLGIHVWIKNSKGEYLISQRAANKHPYPLKWECQGGSVLKGENSLQGALREVEEEVGVDLDPNDGRIVFSRLRSVINGRKFNDIMDVWLFSFDGVASLEMATTDEVAQVKWMNVEEIKELFDKGEFVETLDYFFEEVQGK